jgi:Mg-chelatase subunit ChlD
LGGTPLNDAIIAMMEIVPKFKRDTGVQKVNTIFLTDGASNNLDGIYDYRLNTDTGDHTPYIVYCSWDNDNL